MTEGTLEEKIATMLTAKRALAETVIGTGEQWLSDLDAAELAALVTLGAVYAGSVPASSAYAKNGRGHE